MQLRLGVASCALQLAHGFVAVPAVRPVAAVRSPQLRTVPVLAAELRSVVVTDMDETLIKSKARHPPPAPRIARR
jgi:hypothetical protein